MLLPYQIQKFEGIEPAERWTCQFIKTNRTFFEGLWRRTQEKDNSVKSGWRSDRDARVKLLYFVDEYDVYLERGNSIFCLKAPYLWLFLGVPEQEAETLRDKCVQILSTKWTFDPAKNMYVRGDLNFQLSIQDNPPRQLASRTFPNNYKFFEATISSSKTSIPETKFKNPWDVFKTGIRKPLTPGNPVIVRSICEIFQHLPFQLELGCGPSIEAGIPPLHILHNLYDVSDKEGKFIFCDERFTLLQRILDSPENFYFNSSFSYRTSLTAKPTNFYNLLPELKKIGHLVGDVITNNFDGLAEVVGLKENFVRRYEEQMINPVINFDNNARSLLVVGSHADRRRTQQKARDQGLKIIYIDPEGYLQDTQFRPYPIESPQDNDLVYRVTAQEFAEAYSQEIQKKLTSALTQTAENSVLRS